MRKERRGEERENDIGGEGRGGERKWERREVRGGEGRIRKMHAGRGDIWLEGVSNLGNHYGLKERRGK